MQHREEEAKPQGHIIYQKTVDLKDMKNAPKLKKTKQATIVHEQKGNLELIKDAIVHTFIEGAHTLSEGVEVIKEKIHEATAPAGETLNPELKRSTKRQSKSPLRHGKSPVYVRKAKGESSSLKSSEILGATTEVPILGMTFIRED